MKAYITITAPTRTAKTTLGRIVERALRTSGFVNVFNSDPDRDIREIGLHLVEDDRIREWANSTPVYLLTMTGTVERKKVAPTDKEQILREYEDLKKRAASIGVELNK